MANIKVIFTITLGLQVLICALATDGHSDFDQQLKEQAVELGIGELDFDELLRTRKPVVRTTTTPDGYTKTTTYKLEPNGRISIKSVSEKASTYSNGNQETRTFTINRNYGASGSDIDDISRDWSSKFFGSWPADTPSSTVHRTRTYTGPNGEDITGKFWSSSTRKYLSSPHSSSEGQRSSHINTYTVTNDF